MIQHMIRCMIQCIKKTLGLFVALTAIGCSSQVQFNKQSFVFNGETRNYAVYVPADYDEKKAYPAILFLHGLFEGGNDGKEMTTVGLGPAIAKNPQRWNAIVIFAQTSGSWRDSDEHPLALATLDAAAKKYHINPKRVVLTGLSTGGAAVWRIGANNPQRFAALAPLCAYAAYDEVPKLTKFPIWAFHNSTDPFVSSGSTDEMAKRINAAGGNVRKTIYGRFGHNCWDAAYGDEKVAQWLTSQTK
jgi:predicted peptidase